MVQLEGWSDLMYDSMHTISAVMPVFWVALVIVLAFGLNR
jgi:ABC-type antimicrobial peptide transport system permease subunit